MEYIYILFLHASQVVQSIESFASLGRTSSKLVCFYRLLLGGIRQKNIFKFLWQLMLLGISSRMFDSNEKKRLHYWECFFHSYGAFFLQLALNHTWLIRARVFTLAKLKLSTIKITKTGRQINEPNIYIYIYENFREESMSWWGWTSYSSSC